jgi:HAD superfamily hydrolase (TIGR01484 family)
MRYLVLACDYDGTLATEGRVPPEVIEALQRLRESGRRVCLVTGRILDDLRQVFPQLKLFDRVVAENGAHLFNPETREERVLAEPPPPAFAELLRAREVTPLAVGRVIVATWEPNEEKVLGAIRDLGLELQVIFNKGAVMVLPSGVNKASGVQAALAELHVSSRNCVAIGDAENDHALLNDSELGVAVANALPMLKERADWVTPGPRGEGVIDLVERLLASDLAELEPSARRRELLLGERDDGSKVALPAYGRRLLLCGTSGSGKSTLATALLESVAAQGYGFCLVDPEGDYDSIAGAVVVGDEQTAPKNDEIAHLLVRGAKSVVANLLGVPLEQRPAFLSALLPRLLECRARCGRPHWIAIDEAHHMLSAGSLPDRREHLPTNTLLLTVHPERLPEHVLREVDDLLVVGEEPRSAFDSFARTLGVPPPAVDAAPLASGRALHWSPRSSAEVVALRTTPPKSERRRHRRKYASGALGEDKSFYFRGPKGALNLRAHNLAMFLQIADGVDEETWLHHLAQHDYSSWLRDAVKNAELADEVAAIEAQSHADAELSRRKVREAIERVYTLPA